MEMNDLAPIVLFVYNRIWHTKQTIEALQQNILANKSDIIVYSDGPKNVTNSSELTKIQEVRDYIGSIAGFRSIRIIERKENLGLANSIITGVSEVLEERRKAIIIEDDVVTSIGFLSYMNDALDLYQNKEKVMHISGYMFPVEPQLPKTFFLNTATCWGWATWDRAWNHLILDSSVLIKEIYRKKLVSKINLDNSYNHFEQLIANREGSKKTWAIFWHSSIILNNGFCLHPYPSLVNNIGNDNSGVNSKTSDFFNWKILSNEIEVKVLELNESAKAKRALKSFYERNSRLSIYSRITNWIYSVFNEKTIIKLKALLLAETRKEQRSLNFLSKYPRYFVGYTDILEKQTKFVDAKSFMFLFKELFKDDAYKFHSNKTRPTIIDCGANIGLSIIYFKKIFPQAKIVAFEPDKDIFNVLQYNISESHQLSDVELINAALWIHEDGVNFESEGADAGKISDDESRYTVSTCRLSRYLEDEVDFLKIDIEGVEYEVLKECGDKLKNVRHVFIEYHSFENKPQNLSQILDILTEMDFRYYLTMPGLRSSNPLIKLNKYAGMDMQVNIYAKRM